MLKLAPKPGWATKLPSPSMAKALMVLAISTSPSLRVAVTSLKLTISCVPVACGLNSNIAVEISNEYSFLSAPSPFSQPSFR